MITIEAADAILYRWGELQRMDSIGYPNRTFYCDDHISGYRDSTPDYWADDRVEWALTLLKSSDRNCYHRLKRYYVDGAHQLRISAEREKFCKVWDSWEFVDAPLNAQ